MGKIGGWLAGILAAVIAGYAVWYFTRPPATTIIEGMVYSASSAVPKAMVSLTLTGDKASSEAIHNVTDDNGSYRFDFTGLPSGAGAILRVTAEGFRASAPQTLTSPLGPDVHQDIPMEREVASNRGSPDEERPEAEAPKPRYVRKAAEEATRVQLPSKP